MCHVPGSIWIVPTGCAVWIPAGLRHRSPASLHSRIGILFVKQDAACLPPHCCTLEITPLVREIVLRLVGTTVGSDADEHELRLMKVLLKELEGMPTGGLRLPVSSHPKMVAIQEALMASGRPHDACRMARSDRHQRAHPGPLGLQGNGNDVRSMAATATFACCLVQAVRRSASTASRRSPWLRVGDLLYNNVP